MKKINNVLITQLRLHDYAGSEVVTLELAEYFSTIANSVIVATSSYGKPISDEFDLLENVKVLNILDDKLNDVIKEDGIDIAWIHHQMIPDQLLASSKNTKFIFHHMSPYSEYELPFAFEIENAISDKVLCNSDETLDEFKKQGLLNRLSEAEVLNNASPEEFDRHSIARKKLESILVVSNHIPDELQDAIKLLKQRGVRVSMFGVHNEEYERLRAERISQYDAIVTIGKTVQYSILGRKPIYCYDRFGGPGYLSKENYSLARQLNFSGRGFSKKKPDQIAGEVLSGYNAAVNDVKEFYETDRSAFLLSSRLDAIVRDVMSKEKTENPLTQAEIIRYKALRSIASKGISGTRRLRELEGELTAMQEYRDKYNDILNSRKYKLASVQAAPIKVLRRVSARVQGLIRRRDV